MTKTRCKATSEELIELKKISKILTLANAKTLEIEFRNTQLLMSVKKLGF